MISGGIEVSYLICLILEGKFVGNLFIEYVSNNSLPASKGKNLAWVISNRSKEKSEHADIIYELEIPAYINSAFPRIESSVRKKRETFSRYTADVYCILQDAFRM